MYTPIVYDYIFHRSNSKHTLCWSNWFDLPLFTTRILLREHANISKVVETNDTSSAISADFEMLEGKEIVIRLSDHEPVISTIYIKKWSEWWPFL